MTAAAPTMPVSGADEQAAPLLAAVVRAWGHGPAMTRVLDAARSRLVYVDISASGGVRSFVVANLVAEELRLRPRDDARPVVLVTATTREADDLAEALTCL